jgi:hypothetical protein
VKQRIIAIVKSVVNNLTESVAEKDEFHKNFMQSKSKIFSHHSQLHTITDVNQLLVRIRDVDKNENSNGICEQFQWHTCRDDYSGMGLTNVI